MTFSWDDIGLYHINADVYRVSDGKRVWHSWNNQGVTEMSVPVVMPEQNDSMEQVLDVGEIVLEADETYEVNIGFYRRGNDMLHVRKYVLVTEDAEPDAAITLTVNGSISDASSLVNEDIPMTVEAPENAAAIIVWNGEFWAWFDGSRADFAWGWGSTGERMLFAKYTTDENAREDGDWNSYEWNIVTVSVSKNGNTEAPRVSLSSNSPVRGETLTFTVENAEENGGYHWTVYDTVDDWNWEWRDWEDSATHEIDTYELQSNRTYLLWVYNYGFVGVESDGVKIPFTVTANGTAPAPEVEAADSVAKGDALFIRIKNPDAGDCFRAWFWQEDSGTHDAVEWDGTDTIVLPTHDLTVGAYTELYIENVGSFGVEQSCISMPIAVTEPSGELSLYVERTELVTQQMTHIVAFAAGSEKIDLYACHAEKPDEPFWYESTEEDVLDGYWNFTGHAGAKILTAVATYSDGTTQTLTVNVTVTAPEGNLPEPTIENVPDILTYGQELAFHVNAHNAEWWFVEVSDMTEEGRLMHHWDMQSEDGDFKLEADELVEGHTYGISAYVARYAWEEAGSYKEFTVVQGDDPYAEHVLVLPEALTVIEEEAFEGVAAITVVIPDGAVSIGSRAFADCPSLKYVEIPASVTGIADDAFAGSSVIFICGFDSFAYQYAQEHGIPVR